MAGLDRLDPAIHVRGSIPMMARSGDLPPMLFHIFAQGLDDAGLVACTAARPRGFSRADDPAFEFISAYSPFLIVIPAKAGIQLHFANTRS
jgi:hypothetical protein